MRFQLPHPLVLLLAGVAAAAMLTWVLPAGTYERRLDEASGRQLVVPGTYTVTPSAPVGIKAAVMAVPLGIVAGADVILTVLLVGGAFALLEATGALGRLVGSLVGSTQRPRVVVIGISLGFATLGGLVNTHEEIIALVPTLLVLSRSLGFGSITALAMSVGAAVVGSAFGPTNPYQTGIALRFAELPPMSQPVLRFALFGAAVTIWIAWTVLMVKRDEVIDEPVAVATPSPPTRRDLLLLALAVLPFVPYVIGVVRFDWGFNELSAIFLVIGFAIGLASGLNLTQTSVAFLKGMEGMLAAGLFVGVARGISIVLTDGLVIDTIVQALAAPLSNAPGYMAALMMIPMHAILHIPVPSVSGHAVLTMPIMGPLSDLLGIGRDAAVIAYQAGAGLMDMITPTNGALLAMLLGAKVGYGRWLRFAIPGAMLVGLVAAVGIVIAA